MIRVFTRFSYGLEVEKKDEPLKYKGVVFNEMLPVPHFFVPGLLLGFGVLHFNTFFGSGFL